MTTATLAASFPHSFANPLLTAENSLSPALISIDGMSVTASPSTGILNENRLVPSANDCEEDGGDTTLLPKFDLTAHHLSPTTPTKERTRRATMPEHILHRPKEVFSARSLISTIEMLTEGGPSHWSVLASPHAIF
jgi:hypothetical protein